MSRYVVGRWSLVGAAILGLWALSADPAGVSAQPPAGPKAAPDGKAEEKPLSVEEARERAKLLHRVYSSTLDVMHHRYFRSDRATLPARALEDVFKDIEAETNIQARWIAVSTTAMSIHHEPETEFEKKAARQIAAGEGEFEQVQGGVYQRAGVIPLKAGCVGCHAGPLSAANAKTPKFAGLVIRIPMKAK
jgi:Protein of unknown function (DUF3365)